MTHPDDPATHEEAAEAARLADALERGRFDQAGESAPVALLLSAVGDERDDDVAARRLRSELVRKTGARRGVSPWLWAAAAAVLVMVSAPLVLKTGGPRDAGPADAALVASRERVAAAAVSRVRAAHESSAYASLARSRTDRLYLSLASSRFADLVPGGESAASPTPSLKPTGGPS